MPKTEATYDLGVSRNTGTLHLYVHGGGGHRPICGLAYAVAEVGAFDMETATAYKMIRMRGNRCQRCADIIDSRRKWHTTKLVATKAEEPTMCTCETTGHCTVCRESEAKLRGFQENTHRDCYWCGEWFRINDMFHVGHNDDDTLVCGPDCPRRPERVQTYMPATAVPKPKPKRQWGVYVTTRHYIEAHNRDQAQEAAGLLIREALGVDIHISNIRSWSQG